MIRPYFSMERPAMIEMALNGLAKKLSEVFTHHLKQEVEFKVVHCDLDDASKAQGTIPSGKASGYLRPITVTTAGPSMGHGFGNLRRNNVVVKTEGGAHTIKQHPVSVDVECKFSLYGGHRQIYDCLKAIFDCQNHGAADFALKIGIGTEIYQHAVTIKQEPGSIDIPAIPIDAADEEESIRFNLRIDNVSIIMDTSYAPYIVEFDNRIGTT